MPLLKDRADPLSGPPAPSASSYVLVDDFDGPLCALSVYLSAAERALEADEIDRDQVERALRGAKEQVAVLASRVTGACAER